jgi:carbonic anhydrase/acetyltransferase-like protein (isoleucine patch superfamily)
MVLPSGWNGFDGLVVGAHVVVGTGATVVVGGAVGALEVVVAGTGAVVVVSGDEDPQRIVPAGQFPPSVG